MPAHRTTFSLSILVAIAGCHSKHDIEAAKHSLYDADFATVYSAALDATRELYPNLDDAPGHGAIKTAWHQVQFASNDDDLSNQQTLANANGMGGGSPVNANQAAAGMPTRLAYKRYFIRFDVSVAGGRPWRLKVVGHAAEWEPGAAMPTELHGVARPPWLDGRTDALLVAIYKKIKPYAIPVKEEIKGTDEESHKTDPSAFKDVPPPAAKQLAVIKDALAARDNTALRAALADDVVWSLGGGTGADAAMATWQADPESLDAMGKAIAAGCGGDPKKVACPAGDPKPGQYQLVLEPRGDAWKITSFVRAE